MAVNFVTHSDGDEVLRLARFVQAARRCASDTTLGWSRHLSAVKAADRGERWLYIAYAVRLP